MEDALDLSFDRLLMMMLMIHMEDRLFERPVSTDGKTTHNKRIHIAIIITKLKKKKKNLFSDPYNTT